MQVHMFGRDRNGCGGFVAVEPDGTPARVRHPETGHQTRIEGHECVVTLAGQMTGDCVFADEESGIILEFAPGHRRDSPTRYEVRRGDVTIRVSPTGPCQCDACLGIVNGGTEGAMARA